MTEKQQKILLKSALSDRATRDEVKTIASVHIARQLTIANEIEQEKNDKTFCVAYGKGLEMGRRQVKPTPDALADLLREAQAYIRTTLPDWSKAEDLPPIIHKLHGALDAYERGESRPVNDALVEAVKELIENFIHIPEEARSNRLSDDWTVSMKQMRNVESALAAATKEKS